MDIRHQLDVLTLLRGLGLTVILTLHDLTPGIIAQAFDVTARVDTAGPSPRYPFHL